MADETLVLILQQIGYLLSAIVIPFAALILGIKLYREKRKTRELNYVRLIIFSIFTCFAIMSVLEYFVFLDLFPFLSTLFGYNITEMNMYSVLIGTMVSLGLVLVSYANRWEIFYLM